MTKLLSECSCTKKQRCQSKICISPDVLVKKRTVFELEVLQVLAHARQMDNGLGVDLLHVAQVQGAQARSHRVQQVAQTAPVCKVKSLNVAFEPTQYTFHESKKYHYTELKNQMANYRLRSSRMTPFDILKDIHIKGKNSFLCLFRSFVQILFKI